MTTTRYWETMHQVMSVPSCAGSVSSQPVSSWAEQCSGGSDDTELGWLCNFSALMEMNAVDNLAGIPI